jgi:hypothetical protein
MGKATRRLAAIMWESVADTEHAKAVLRGYGHLDDESEAAASALDETMRLQLAAACRTPVVSPSWAATTSTASNDERLTRYHTKRLAALGYAASLTKAAA